MVKGNAHPLVVVTVSLRPVCAKVRESFVKGGTGVSTDGMVCMTDHNTTDKLINGDPPNCYGALHPVCILTGGPLSTGNCRATGCPAL